MLLRSCFVLFFFAQGLLVLLGVLGMLCLGACFVLGLDLRLVSLRVVFPDIPFRVLGFSFPDIPFRVYVFVCEVVHLVDVRRGVLHI